MATFYSNHYGPEMGETGHFTTLKSPVDTVAAGLGHSRLRHKACQFIVPNGQDMALQDTIRLMDVSSTDRLVQLLFSCDGNFGTTAVANFGLALKGTNNDGALVETAGANDLFGSAVVISSAIARVDVALDGTAAWDRCKPMWFFAGASADTAVDYTIIMEWDTNPSPTDAATECLCELIYLSGD